MNHLENCTHLNEKELQTVFNQITLQNICTCPPEDRTARNKKIEAGAKDFAVRFEGVTKELAGEEIELTEQKRRPTEEEIVLTSQSNTPTPHTDYPHNKADHSTEEYGVPCYDKKCDVCTTPHTKILEELNENLKEHLMVRPVARCGSGDLFERDDVTDILAQALTSATLTERERCMKAWDEYVDGINQDATYIIHEPVREGFKIFINPRNIQN